MNQFANFLSTFPIVGIGDLGKDYCHGFISPALILEAFTSEEFTHDCDYDDEDDCDGWWNWESTMESQWECGDYNFDSLSHDIETFGFGTPVLLNTETRTYWNGHHRLYVANDMSLPFIPFVSGSHYFRVECDHFYATHETTSYHVLGG